MSKSFSASYLSNDPDAQPFLPLDFRKSEDRTRAVHQATSYTCSPKLLQALLRQNKQWGLSQAQEKHLEQLSQPGTTVVVTGQQVGLFMGPLYTFYKAASAILIAQELSKESGKPVVPLFWLQTEDHDFEEIRATYAPRSTGHALRLEMLEQRDESNRRCSVNHRKLDDNIITQCEALAEHIDGLPFADSIQDLLKDSYQPTHSWGDAFAIMLSRCFAEEGLLLLNPRDPDIAALGAGVHQRSMLEGEHVYNLLANREAELVSKGYRIQVAPREGCCLSFFHPEGPEENRYRLQYGEPVYSLAGSPKTYSQQQLMQSLQESPLSWSTSALLRPIYQDHLLPTAAYVGGPGELAYFAQLAPLYKWFGRPMPVIVPRGRFVVVDEKTRTHLHSWNMKVSDLQRSREELLTELQTPGEQGLHPETLHKELFGPFAEKLSQYQEAMLALDPGLEKTARKTSRSVENAIDKLVQKVQRIQLNQDQALVERVRRLQAMLFPDQKPQERIFGLPYFAARYGLSRLKQLIQEEYRPFVFALEELKP